jgi:hypothetical protein
LGWAGSLVAKRYRRWSPSQSGVYAIARQIGFAIGISALTAALGRPFDTIRPSAGRIVSIRSDRLTVAICS